jgi:hypothetical protein
VIRGAHLYNCLRRYGCLVILSAASGKFLRWLVMKRVTIVGAGLVGSFVYLFSQKYKVSIYERRPICEKKKCRQVVPSILHDRVSGVGSGHHGGDRKIAILCMADVFIISMVA